MDSTNNLKRWATWTPPITVVNQGARENSRLLKKEYNVMENVGISNHDS
jgi:hypothetical protein